MKSLGGGTIESPSVLDQFLDQVEADPDRPAVVDSSTLLTYGDLAEASRVVAERLATAGIGRGSLVAVILENSANLVAILLGVLRSGASYLPLSANDPAPRIDKLVAHARADLRIVDHERRPNHRTQDGIPVLTAAALVRRDGAPAIGPRGNTCLPGPHDVAYVIYTSGSTGWPKGVLVEHRALSSYMAYATAHYRGLSGVTLMHSSIAFDMSVTSIYGPLITGGAIHVVDLQDAMAGRVPEHLEQPTFLKVTPSHLPILEALPGAFSPSQTLVIGGEALHWEAVRQWRLQRPAVEVFNEYGPTEATVGCCVHALESDDMRSGPVPIGWPTDGASLRVLDAAGDPVVPGALGELHIGGAQVALGYLHSPTRTAERFLPDPAGLPGARMYATGDTVRALSTGALEYRGRGDGQVKVDGFRVEVAEVEAAILRTGLVSQVVVVPRTGWSGSTELAAVVAGPVGQRESPDPVEARRRLARELPHHMIPKHIEVVPEFRLADSGKLDRTALPDQTRDGGPTTDEHAVVRQLLGLVRQVVGTEIGPADSLVSAGLGSVDAARLVGLARRSGLDLALSDVMRGRTVAGIVRLHRSAPHAFESKEG